MATVNVDIRQLFTGTTDVLTPLYDLVNWSDDGKLFLEKPGHQHYRLLAYMSSQLKPGSKILEIGTRWGASAVALASNKDVHVTTCDLTEDRRRPPKDNITYVIEDGYNMLDDCHEYAMIFIDVDPHDGVQERKMIRKLLDNQYKGIVLLDDIRLNQEMYNFWASIPLPDEHKIDMTSFGHYSGTGMLLLSTSSYESSEERPQSD